MTAEVHELESQSLALTAQASNWPVIATAGAYTEAAELAEVLTGLDKSVEEYWAPLKKSAHATWKNLVEKEKEMLQPLNAAICILKSRMKAYLDEQEKIRQEQERAAQEAAKKAQDEQALTEAQQLEAAGQPEAAARVLEDAMKAPAPIAIIPSSVPTVKGMSLRGNWKFRIVNRDLVPKDYWVLDEQKIGAVVRAMKQQTNIPGIQAYKDTNVSIRG